MKRPAHGGGVDRAAQELNLPREQILDFSASINPQGVPATVRLALDQALERIADYPQIDANSLRHALANHHDLPPECLLPGSGSTELIYLLPRALKPRRAVIVEPAFSEYAPALQQAGCVVDRFALDPADRFRFDSEALIDSLHPEVDLVWLANPGNPSGVGIDPDQLRCLAMKLGARRLIIDEAFVDFSPELSLIDAVLERDNLIILRSMTKFYAIPGLRVGYLAGPPKDVAVLAAGRLPWALSGLAIAAAEACLWDSEYRRRSLDELDCLRDQLETGLQPLAEEIYPSRANYLLLRLHASGPGSRDLCRRLRGKGILLRNCCDFYPLDDRYLRVAVRTADENRRLVDALIAEVAHG